MTTPIESDTLEGSMISGASADADRATAATQSNPQAVSSKADIPSASDTVRLGDREVLRFHPLHKRIRDKIPRCIACGQIDEDGYHVSAWCPGAGGEFPFPTSTLKMNLKADSGFRSESSHRIKISQWVLINRVLAEPDAVPREIVDQDGKVVGTAYTPVSDLMKVEAFVDEDGTAWTPPTAWAYFAACRALRKDEARYGELVSALLPFAHLFDSEVCDASWSDDDDWFAHDGCRLKVGHFRDAARACGLLRDTDGRPKGTDAQRQDGEAATAGAEGIAEGPRS